MLAMLLLYQNAYALIPHRCQEHTKHQSVSNAKIKPKQKTDIAFNNKSLFAKQLGGHRTKIYQTLLKNGISVNSAKRVYKLQFLERPIASSKVQPEFTMTIDIYVSKFLRHESIARSFMQEHLSVLTDAEQIYNIDKEVITALITMESMAGHKKGDIHVLNTLFTLSYYSRRSNFFTDELVAAFKLMESKKYNFVFETKGSWAGAMGYTQFMPSSVLHYGADGDNDGVIDIINNPRDAIYSAAMYLSKAGWKRNEKILKEMMPEELTNIDICSTIDKSFENGKLILPENEPKERFFIVYNNYHSILRWNRSFLFAYTVHTVSERLKQNNS